MSSCTALNIQVLGTIPFINLVANSTAVKFVFKSEMLARASAAKNNVLALTAAYFAG